MGHSSDGHNIFILWLKLPGRSHAASSHQKCRGAGWIWGWVSGEYLVLVPRLVGHKMTSTQKQWQDSRACHIGKGTF